MRSCQQPWKSGTWMWWKHGLVTCHLSHNRLLVLERTFDITCTLICLISVQRHPDWRYQPIPVDHDLPQRFAALISSYMYFKIFNELYRRESKLHLDHIKALLSFSCGKTTFLPNPNTTCTVITAADSRLLKFLPAQTDHRLKEVVDNISPYWFVCDLSQVVITHHFILHLKPMSTHFYCML